VEQIPNAIHTPDSFCVEKIHPPIRFFSGFPHALQLHTCSLGAVLFVDTGFPLLVPCLED
jgi:hypothetical protein